jgi:hypothetical protein
MDDSVSSADTPVEIRARLIVRRELKQLLRGGYVDLLRGRDRGEDRVHIRPKGLRYLDQTRATDKEPGRKSRG